MDVVILMRIPPDCLECSRLTIVHMTDQVISVTGNKIQIQTWDTYGPFTFY